jgi:arylsulfatase A-like enzyme
VHYFDPHSPYEHRQPWFDAYIGEPPPSMTPDQQKVPPELIKALRETAAGYDSEIAYVDDHLRTLFEALAIDSSALVVVTSDHGEAFLEHGAFGHGNSLFEEEIRIPLIVRMPDDVPGRRVDTMVSIADVFPTILEVVGITPPAGIVGRSLVPILHGDRLPDIAISTELDRGPVPQHTVRSGQWKLYRKDRPEEFVHLYDLAVDPLERNDRADVERARVRDLDAVWDGFAKKWPKFTAAQVLPAFGKDQIDRLRALGYVDDH